MKAETARGLPILVLLVLVGLCLAAGAADAQWDGKTANPPGEGCGPPDDHGGGDPDNPVPVDGGEKPPSYQGDGIEVRPLYVGTGEDSSFSRDLVTLMSTITGVLDSVLFL